MRQFSREPASFRLKKGARAHASAANCAVYSHLYKCANHRERVISYILRQFKLISIKKELDGSKWQGEQMLQYWRHPEQQADSAVLRRDSAFSPRRGLGGKAREGWE